MQNWMGGGGLEEGSFSSKTSTSIPSSPTVGNASSASEGVIDYHDNVLHHPLHHAPWHSPPPPPPPSATAQYVVHLRPPEVNLLIVKVSPQIIYTGHQASWLGVDRSVSLWTDRTAEATVFPKLVPYIYHFDIIIIYNLCNCTCLKCRHFVLYFFQVAWKTEKNRPGLIAARSTASPEGLCGKGFLAQSKRAPFCTYGTWTCCDGVSGARKSGGRGSDPTAPQCPNWFSTELSPWVVCMAWFICHQPHTLAGSHSLHHLLFSRTILYPHIISTIYHHLQQHHKISHQTTPIVT